jgi:hypothetical protein
MHHTLFYPTTIFHQLYSQQPYTHTASIAKTPTTIGKLYASLFPLAMNRMSVYFVGGILRLIIILPLMRMLLPCTILPSQIVSYLLILSLLLLCFQVTSMLPLMR